MWPQLENRSIPKKEEVIGFHHNLSAVRKCTVWTAFCGMRCVTIVVCIKILQWCAKNYFASLDIICIVRCGPSDTRASKINQICIVWLCRCVCVQNDFLYNNLITIMWEICAKKLRIQNKKIYLSRSSSSWCFKSYTNLGNRRCEHIDRRETTLTHTHIHSLTPQTHTHTHLHTQNDP